MSQRRSGIELLRLVSMFGIVLSHWGGHGSWELTSDNSYFINKVFLQLTQYLGEIGNCVFVLITGYFLALQDTINTKGIVRVIKDVKIYAFIIWLVVSLCGICEFKFMGGVISLFPICYSQYWFVAPFLAILVLSPWINQILKSLTKRQFYCYFGILTAIELILPLGFAKTISSNTGVFILFYSVGALIQIKPEIKEKFSRMRYYLVAVGFTLAITSTALLDLVLPRLGLAPVLSMLFIGRFSIVPIICALGLFLIFDKLNIVSGFINKSAQSAFAVYLISENPNVFPWFWKAFCNNIEYYSAQYMIGIALLQCMIVFVFCIVIDMIYTQIYAIIKNIFEKL